MNITKERKLFRTLLLVLLLFLAFSGSIDSLGSDVHAASENDKVVVLGSGLSELERIDTLSILGINNGGESEYHIVNAKDAKRFTGKNFADSGMISSVVVEFLDEGEGVSTEIVSPDNISTVESYQYSNAAITAGVYDCNIYVGAIRPVTGNSALTGVYKAAEIHGVNLDKDKLEAGQDELITVRIIEDNNASNEDFNSEDFSKALTEIKAAITQMVDEKGKENVTIEEIRVEINQVLNEYNINIPEVDQELLAQTLEKFKSTINQDDIDKILEQLKSFGEKTWNMTQDFIETAKEEGWWQNIVNFFRQLFSAIAEFFRNLFNN